MLMTIHRISHKSDLRLLLLAVVGCFFILSGKSIGQTVRQTPAAEGWLAAEAIKSTVLVHQTPNESSFVTDSIRRGELIWVREIGPESDWLLVRPPEGALSWVLESDISEIRGNEARIKSDRTFIRPGRVGARLPGPPGVELLKGERVWLLSREPLVLPQQSRLMTWRAIEPPTGEPRFALRDDLKLIHQSPKSSEVGGFEDATGPGNLAANRPDLNEKSGQSQTQSGKNLKNQTPLRNEIQSPGKNEMQPGDPTDGDNEISNPESKSAKSKDNISESPSIESLAIIEPPKSLINSTQPGVLESLPESLNQKKPKQIELPADKFKQNLPPMVVEPQASPIALPGSPEAAIETLESRFRIMMDQPLVMWNFKPILEGCDELRKQSLTPEQSARLNAIRDRAGRQDEIGQSARKFWDSMRRSRSSDPGKNPDLNILRASNTNPFDVTGLMLPSRRDLDGQILYNLIGDGGNTIAYLKLPPAAPVDKWLGKKVGIRGRARFNEDLRARLVVVQDVEVIEDEQN